MTGMGITLSVNRAFKVMGALFMLAGIYYGLLLYFDPNASTGVVSVQGTVGEMRIERVRPLGFEHIPLDSTDPDHASVPISTNLFAKVSYSWEGVDYRGEIVSWGKPRDWAEGGPVELYLIEGEYDIPLDYFPAGAVKGKQEALIVGFAASFAGLALLVAGLLSQRGDRRRALQRAQRAGEQKIRGGIAVPSGTGKVLEAVNRGNLLMAAVLELLGIILIASMGYALFTEETFYDQLISGFPVIIGVALVYLGLGEFGRERIVIDSGYVHLIRHVPGKSLGRTVGLNTFA